MRKVAAPAVVQKVNAARETGSPLALAEGARPTLTLVTGGAGFLGSHLCERLLGEGHAVYCLDNLLTGRRSNIAKLEEHPRFTFLQQDVKDAIPLDRVDEIYNLASPASPVDYQRDPVGTLLTSVLGAVNVLELARRTGATVLQSSTSEVYGDPLQHPQREGYWGNVNPIGKRACYDEGKRCAETLFFDYARTHGVKIKVVRIFNTYGPRMRPDDGRVVSNFITQALRGDAITIYGTGEQTRSFCYVDDLVEGLVRMMRSAPAVTGPINLGNPGEFTVRELADIVIGELGNASIVHEPLPQDDPRQRRPDIALASELLGWQPRVPLIEGLRMTISHFAEELQLTTGAKVAAE